ncbi:ABC transporter permease [Winogradskya humida]|uniref:ABC transporter permease n=1 Tax=Winogradskya humida TaxID=113566 RepID=A0ABQ3ZUL6_9ACTN|nr:FtsX-like permease family protein [Actinoplanes humidus]GIE22295.1 ABC transporter permease [Actinoplanes humidus]
MSLAFTMVRHRFAAFAGTFVAIALGVALVAGACTLWASSRPQVPERYNSAPVLVHSPTIGKGTDGYPDYRSWTPAEARDKADQLSTVPGVTAAIPDPTFYVQELIKNKATGDPEASRTAGHAYSSAELGGYHLTAGTPPSKPGEVVLRGSTPGGTIDVLTAAGPEHWTVTGTVDGPGFYLSDAAAMEQAGGVRVIGLTGDPQTSAITGLFFTGGDRDKLEDESVTRIRWLGAQLIIAMVTLGVFVAVFVVASTCALSAAQRRREIGLLRAVGATPGQVVRLMYAETLVVAVLGGAVGVPVGALAAPLLASPLVNAGLEPAGFAVTLQPAVLAGAFLLGVVVALAGVWSSARRSSRVPALDALRDAAVERRAMTVPRWIFGLLTAAGGAALTVALPSLPPTTQTTAALFAAMLLLVAAALLAPVVIVPLVRLVTWPWRGGATGMLVREGTLTGVRRVASTAAPVLLTVGFATLLTGTIATIEQATRIDETAKLPAIEVAAPDNTPGLSEAAVAGQPGDAPLRSEMLMTIGGTTSAYQVTGKGDAKGVILSRDLTDRPKRVDVVFRDGTTATLPVTGTHDGPAELADVPRTLLREHDPQALADAVMLNGPAHVEPGMKVLTARQYVTGLVDEEGQIIDLFLLVLISLTVGYTGLAVANTLLMATAGRRTEFRALRLAGGGTGHVLRVTTGEALLAVAAGTLLGGGVAAAALLGMRRATQEELRQSVDLVIPWGQAVPVVLICALVAVVAAGAPVFTRKQSRNGGF